MSPSAQRLLARVGGWPRRLAALFCLLLAAATALLPQRAGPGRAPGEGRLATRLHAHEVAVPVPIDGAAAAAVRAGDRVGVLASLGGDGLSAVAAAGAQPGAVLIADRLRVLSVTSAAGGPGDSAALVTVATDRAHARALAAYAHGSFTLIVDDVP